MLKALIFTTAAVLALSARVACADDEHMVLSPDFATSAMKHAIPVVQKPGGSPFVIDSKGCLWGIGEDREMGVVGAIRIVDEDGKQVCRPAK